MKLTDLPRGFILSILLASTIGTLTGCQNAPATGPVDPFLGRTRVPPPGTGSAGGMPIDPSYQGALPSPHLWSRGGPDVSLPPAPSANLISRQGRKGTGQTIASGIKSTNPAVQPASFTEEGAPSVSLGDVVTIEEPSAADSPRPANLSRQGEPPSRDEPPAPRASIQQDSRPESPPATARWSGEITRGQPIVRTIHPPADRSRSMHQPLATTSVPAMARAMPASSHQHQPVVRPAVAFQPTPAVRPVTSPRVTRAVNIVDLPRHNATAQQLAPAANSARKAQGFRLVSATGPSDSPAITPDTAEDGFSPAGLYGHDQSYAWLRGRLEYSQVDQRWKLRYIPVDGDTDEHGGSVVLPDEAKLAGCERGDFVEVHGRILSDEPKLGFSPCYQVDQLKRLARADD